MSLESRLLPYIPGCSLKRNDCQGLQLNPLAVVIMLEYMGQGEVVSSKIHHARGHHFSHMATELIGLYNKSQMPSPGIQRPSLSPSLIQS